MVTVTVTETETETVCVNGPSESLAFDATITPIDTVCHGIIHHLSNFTVHFDFDGHGAKVCSLLKVSLVTLFSAERAAFCTWRGAFVHLRTTPLCWRARNVAIAMSEKSVTTKSNIR